MDDSEKRHFLRQLRGSILEDHNKIDEDADKIKERVSQWGRSVNSTRRKKSS
jgi:hypothetical protein